MIPAKVFSNQHPLILIMKLSLKKTKNCQDDKYGHKIVTSFQECFNTSSQIYTNETCCQIHKRLLQST